MQLYSGYTAVQLMTGHAEFEEYASHHCAYGHALQVIIVRTFFVVCINDYFASNTITAWHFDKLLAVCQASEFAS
jgi:hypothetical protein